MKMNIEGNEDSAFLGLPEIANITLNEKGAAPATGGFLQTLHKRNGKVSGKSCTADNTARSEECNNMVFDLVEFGPDGQPVPESKVTGQWGCTCWNNECKFCVTFPDSKPLATWLQEIAGELGDGEDTINAFNSCQKWTTCVDQPKTKPCSEPNVNGQSQHPECHPECHGGRGSKTYCLNNQCWITRALDTRLLVPTVLC